jgi:hypothetical protein
MPPPTDVSILQYIGEAIKEFPSGPKVFLGDLSSHLKNPRNDRAMIVANYMADLELLYNYGDYRHSKKHRKSFTWWQRRNNKIIRAKCDFILGSERNFFKNVCLKDPRHYSSDHFMVLGTLIFQPRKSIMAYQRKRKKFPLKMTRRGPKTKATILRDQILRGGEKAFSPEMDVVDFGGYVETYRPEDIPPQERFTT